MSGHPRGGKSETKVAIYEEKKQRFKTEDATVEVTVKLKKRSDKSRGKHRLDHVQNAESIVHRAGSWGDLLLRQKQLAESQTSVNHKGGDEGQGVARCVNGNTNTDSNGDFHVQAQGGKHQKRKSRREKVYQPSSGYSKEHGHDCTDRDRGKRWSGVRVQIPISEGQGSHTKCCEACTCFVTQKVKDEASQTSLLAPPIQIINKIRSPPTKERESYGRAPPGKEREPYERAPLIKERETYERAPSMKERETYGRAPGIKEREPYVRATIVEHPKPKVSQSVPDKPGGRRSSSRRSEILTIKRSEDAQVQTREVSAVIHDTEDSTENANLLKDLKKLSELEKENLMLKQDTYKLLEQVEKSKNERQEYITTIKELYELAEVLRHENVILIGTHEEHRTLEEKLGEALGENIVLKRHLDELSTRISQSTVDKSAKDNEIRDFWKVRDVLKEVKSVISEEINGLQQTNGRNSPSQMDESDILELFGRTKDQKEFNDTNVQCDDEIQKILNASKENADRSDIRSSTQYLDVEDGEIPASGSQRNYVPSPDSDPSSL